MLKSLLSHGNHETLLCSHMRGLKESLVHPLHDGLTALSRGGRSELQGSGVFWDLVYFWKFWAVTRPR